MSGHDMPSAILPCKEKVLLGAPQPPAPEEPQEPEPDAIYVFRRERCLELGFEEPWCGVLAALKEVDLHRLAWMLRQGCSHSLVLRIVL